MLVQVLVENSQRGVADEGEKGSNDFTASKWRPDRQFEAP